MVEKKGNSKRENRKKHNNVERKTHKLQMNTYTKRILFIRSESSAMIIICSELSFFSTIHIFTTNKRNIFFSSVNLDSKISCHFQFIRRKFRKIIKQNRNNNNIKYVCNACSQITYTKFEIQEDTDCLI